MTPLMHEPIRLGDAVLLPVTADLVAAVAADERCADWHPEFPREDDRDVIAMTRPGAPWSSWVIADATGLLVGTIGFFGPPAQVDAVPEVEIGYGVVESARGRGLMTVVLPAVLARTDALGVRVRAGTVRDNAASLALLRRCGFVVRAEPTDDPERELVLARELS